MGPIETPGHALPYLPLRPARRLVQSSRSDAHVQTPRNGASAGPFDSDPVQPYYGPVGSVRLPPRTHQGGPSRPAGHPVERSRQGTAGPRAAPPASAREDQRTGEDRKATSDALPHA